MNYGRTDGGGFVAGKWEFIRWPRYDRKFEIGGYEPAGIRWRLKLGAWELRWWS